MNDPEINRLSRLMALVTLLQTKRLLTASELAERFSVSTRTIYRDIRTLEAAGIPIVTEEGKGYTLLEGYRLPPVLFTRDEAIALLTAEKLTVQFTDPATSERYGTAMDKLRAALRRSDRDHLESIEPFIQVKTSVHRPNVYQQLVTAIPASQVVRIIYRAAESGETTSREIEPIGLYLSQHWHVIAFCRLRQNFRDFRLDRIQDLVLRNETYKTRTETLQQYWAGEEIRRSKEKVVLHFSPSELIPSLSQLFQDTKHQYGWINEEILDDHTMKINFLVGSLPYMASWLLTFAGAVQIIEPPALGQELKALAQRTFDYFAGQGR